MIGTYSPAELFSQLVKAVFEDAPAYGYKKSGNLIKKIAYGNAAIVEFQRSRNNTKDSVQFTLNLAIVNGEMLKIDGLMYPFGTTLQSAKSSTSHMDFRIGQIIGKSNKWWEITKNTNVEDLIFELKEAIYQKGIPYIEQYLKSEDLLDLWVSNGYHGLTLGLRDRYIAALLGILKNQPDQTEPHGS